MKMPKYILRIGFQEFAVPESKGAATLMSIMENAMPVRSNFCEEEITLETRTGDFEVDGLVSIEDLHDDSGIEIPEGPYETASGFVMHFLGRIPVVGDVVNVNGIRIAVLTMEGKRAGQLLISRN